MLNSYDVAEDVHRRVNLSVTYKTDLEQYGKLEHWTPATNVGDCEDFALLKQHILWSMGWPSNKTALCLCSHEGVGHCVLYVETERGGFILDNNYSWPMKPSSLPYVWHSMLMGGVWYEIRGWHSR